MCVFRFCKIFNLLCIKYISDIIYFCATDFFFFLIYSVPIFIDLVPKLFPVYLNSSNIVLLISINKKKIKAEFFTLNKTKFRVIENTFSYENVGNQYRTVRAESGKSIIETLKSQRLRWDEHLARMGEDDTALRLAMSTWRIETSVEAKASVGRYY